MGKGLILLKTTGPNVPCHPHCVVSTVSLHHQKCSGPERRKIKQAMISLQNAYQGRMKEEKNIKFFIKLTPEFQEPLKH